MSQRRGPGLASGFYVIEPEIAAGTCSHGKSRSQSATDFPNLRSTPLASTGGLTSLIV